MSETTQDAGARPGAGGGAVVLPPRAPREALAYLSGYLDALDECRDSKRARAIRPGIVAQRQQALDALAAPPAPAPAGEALPYEVVSVNGRAMEWKLPLWEAIRLWRESRTTKEHEAGVVAVERAVERAMRLAVECTAPAPAPGAAGDADDARLLRRIADAAGDRDVDGRYLVREEDATRLRALAARLSAPDAPGAADARGGGGAGLIDALAGMLSDGNVLLYHDDDGDLMAARYGRVGEALPVLVAWIGSDVRGLLRAARRTAGEAGA